MSAASDDSSRRAVRWAGTGLIGAIVLVYANTLQAPFVYDDIQAIVENPSIRRLWPLTDVLRPEVAGGVTVSGRPVLNLSLALSYALSGERVWGYHVFNILVHAGAALLLFGIVRRTLVRRRSPETLAAGRGTRVGSGQSLTTSATATAFAGAAIWALHPLQTQAVTYTVQRAESLMGCFYLLTLYAFVRGTEGAAGVKDPPYSARWLAVSVGACVLGMGTKEVMATAPLVVLLYDRTFGAGSFGRALRERPTYYAGLAATWLVLGALVLSTGGNRGGTVGLGVGVPWWAYGLTQFQAVVRYLALAAWPFPLVFEYGTFWVKRATEVLPYAAVLSPLLVATAIALRPSKAGQHRRWRAAGFCGASFFLILAPTSLTPGTIQMIVEHRMYLPLAAVVSVLVVGLRAWAGRAAPIFAGTIVVALGTLTAARNGDYRSGLALWTDTVAKRPDNPRAHQGLAEALTAMGRLDEAIAHHQESVRLKPDESQYHFNLASTLAASGRTEDATRHYETAVRLAPNEPRAHNNLAVALEQRGRVDEAFAHYERAQALAPREPEFFYNHGRALARQGRTADALHRFDAARRLRPRNPAINLNLGVAFASASRYAEAAECLRAALDQERDNPKTHLLLGDALLELARPAEAATHYETALRLRPGHAETHHNLGVAYTELQRWADAERAFETALRLKPDYAAARRNLEKLRQMLGR